MSHGNECKNLYDAISKIVLSIEIYDDYNCTSNKECAE